MAVLQSDLSLKKPEVSNDLAAQNGGRLTNDAITAALFPDVTGTERTNGLTRYRKVFFKNEAGTGSIPNKFSDTTLSLLSGKMFIENISASGDYFLLKAGTPSDVQSNVVNSGWAGTGYLEADVAINATTLQVRCEIDGVAGEIFQDGGTVLLSSYVNGVGVREFITLDSSSGVVWGTGGNTNRATLTFTATPLQNAFKRSAINTGGNGTRTADIVSAMTIGYTLDAMTTNAHVGQRVHIISGTGAGQFRRVVSNTATTLTVEYAWSVTPSTDSVYEVIKTYACMCVALGDVKCAYSAVSLDPGNTGTGTFDASQLKLLPVGTRDESWTLLFSGGPPATTFSITGTYYGAITAGGPFSVNATAQPANGSSRYFDIPAAAWGGAFNAGDRVYFSTQSASKSVWIKEVVPVTVPAVNPHLANSVDLGASGDTV